MERAIEPAVERASSAGDALAVYDKAAAAREAEDRAAELAKVAKAKAERDHRARIEAECKRLVIPRLMTIKGVRRLRPVLVQLDATSLVRRDHFLLETETHLYHYKGEFAPFTTQRTKAVERAQEALQAERMVPLKLVSVNPDSRDPREFWELLKGSKFSVGEGVGDNMWELKYVAAQQLYRYDPEMGLMPEAEVTCQVLDKKGIFVLVAPGEHYVWYGKETGLLRRNQAKAQAAALPRQGAVGSKDSAWVAMREIHQGAEDYLFRAKFPDWIEMSATGVPLDPQVLLEIFSRKMLDFNPGKVTQITDVDGALDIWVAKDHGKVPISKVSYGEFFNGNSYIVLYQGGQGRVIYFWQGAESHVSWDHAADSIKAVQKIALSSVDLLRRKKTTVPVVRVAEGDEPPHLLALFNGVFIVRHGKFDSFDRSLLVMYHVRGTDPFSCRVMQCSLSRKALRTADAFVLYSPKSMFVWRGRACNDFAAKAAKRLSERMVAMETVALEEGSETQAFWDLLGGKMEMKDMEKKRVKGRKCAKCGHGNPAEGKFCRKCGASMDRPATDRRSTRKMTHAPSASLPTEDLSRLVIPGPASRRESRRGAGDHKPGKRCTSCGKGNPPTNKFCRGCGGPMAAIATDDSLSDTSQSDSDTSMVIEPAKKSTTSGRMRERSSSAPAHTVACPSCKKANMTNVKFCKYCGVPMAGAPALGGAAVAAATTSTTAPAAAAAPATPSPVAAPPAAMAPLPSLGNICGGCGHENAPEDKFCLSCGSKLATPASVAASMPLPTATSQVLVSAVPVETQCAACGTWNEPGCKFCADCGETLAKPDTAKPKNTSSSSLPTATSAVGSGRPEPSPRDRDAMVPCPKCRRPNPCDKKFCRRCGTAMDAPPPPPKSDSGKTTTASSSSDSESGSSGSGGKRASRRGAEAEPGAVPCRQCGKPNPATNVFCKRCGTRFAGSAPKPSEGAAAALMRRPSSAFLEQQQATKKGPRERGVRCPDPECAKPNRPGESNCRVCGKPLPPPPASATVGKSGAGRLAALVKEASGDDVGGGAGGRPQIARTGSAAFLAKRTNQSAFENEVGDWLKRREQGSEAGAPAATPNKSGGALARVAALEAKKAAEKEAAEAKAAEERKRKEEEQAALEARRWTMPKLFVVQDNSILAKRNCLQVHLRNEGTQAVVDARDVMWVWLGLKTNDDQAQFARDLAKFYADVVLKESQRKATVKECKQNAEPPDFVKHFQGWEYGSDAPQRGMHFSVASLSAQPILTHGSSAVDIPRPQVKPSKGLSRSSPSLPSPRGELTGEEEASSAVADAPAVDTPTDNGAAAAASDPVVDTAGGAEPVAAEAVNPSSEVPAAAAAVDPAAVAPEAVRPSKPPSLVVMPAPSGAAPSAVVPKPAVSTTQSVLGLYDGFFPLERLQNTATLPPTLNMSSLESYLCDEDFARLFKMSRSDFASQPAWKKVAQKKAHGLF